ncbi:MAG: metallophosphoesterase [Proteobacteria bacterium]|nr:metallophosphoesterase [Pseudomonadota bacterium]
MKIGHISDIHWLDTTGARPGDFFNKRLSGAFNLLAGRAKKHSKETARMALEMLRDLKIDHLIVTGDLSNLALPGEFSAVRHVLDSYFEDAQMSIVPGNHDFYTGESLKARRFEKMIYTHRPGNVDLGTEDVWPFVNVFGDVAVIGLNSAQPRPWFVAAGRLGVSQLEALEKALNHPEVAGRFKIVALHHHLFQVVMTPGESLRQLEDRAELLDICRRNNVGLIVHGHNHDYTFRYVEPVLVCEAGSCSVCRFKRDVRAGKFNIYTVEERKLCGVETYRYADGAFALWQSYHFEGGEWRCRCPDR